MANPKLDRKALCAELVAFTTRLQTNARIPWWRETIDADLPEWERNLKVAVATCTDPAFQKLLAREARLFVARIKKVRVVQAMVTTRENPALRIPSDQKNEIVQTTLAITNILQREGLEFRDPTAPTPTKPLDPKPATRNARTPMGPRIFISHAAKDSELVDVFVDLLRLGIGVPKDEIFCTSREDMGLRHGDRFIATIKQKLKDAVYVVAVLTPNFYSSPFCLCELGAVWMAANDKVDEDDPRQIVPLLVPPFGYSDLKAILGETEGAKLDSPGALNQIHDTLLEKIPGINGVNTSKWNKERDKFLAKLGELVANLPAPPTVPRSELDALKKQFDKCQADYNNLDDKHDQLKEQLKDLRKLKPKKQVAKVTAKHSTAIEQFNALTKAAKEALIPLPRVVVRALFYETRGEPFHPRPEDDEYFRTAIEDGLIASYDPNEGGFLSETNPKVRKAYNHLKELQVWLDTGCDGVGHDDEKQFYEWYASKNDDEPDMKFRPFWHAHLSTQV